MRRQQIIIFALLFVVSTVPLFLNQHTNIVLARGLSIVLLFPARVATSFTEYLTISTNRIEKLEILLTRLQLENALLKDQLNIDTTGMASDEYVLLKAAVIGRDPLNINGYLHINKGTSHGVRINEPVVAVGGIVGKVRHTGLTTSLVETIENTGFTVSAMDMNTGIHGMIRRQNDLKFLYVRLSDTISIGDSVMTSGMSEVFPKGILIGTVRAIVESDDMFFRDVYVAPAVQVNRLVSVYLIQSVAPARRHD